MSGLDSPVSIVLLAAILVTSLVALYRMPRLIGRLALRPYQVARGRYRETVITSGFVHGDMGHLLFNAFTFYFFAFSLERYIGSLRFAALYAIGLIVSSMASVLRHRDDQQYATIGASGAVSAVLFAYIVYFPTATLIVFPLPIPIPALLFAIGYVAYSYWASNEQRGRINHDAHLWGALAGVAFVLITDPGALAGLIDRVG